MEAHPDSLFLVYSKIPKSLINIFFLFFKINPERASRDSKKNSKISSNLYFDDLTILNKFFSDITVQNKLYIVISYKSSRIDLNAIGIHSIYAPINSVTSGVWIDRLRNHD